MQTGDAVNHPSHYNTGKIEVIEFIEDQKLGYHLGNAIKYIARSPHKGSEVQDLKKARWYIDRQLELLTSYAQANPPRRPNDMNERAT